MVVVIEWWTGLQIDQVHERSRFLDGDPTAHVVQGREQLRRAAALEFPLRDECDHMAILPRSQDAAR